MVQWFFDWKGDGDNTVGPADWGPLVFALILPSRGAKRAGTRQSLPGEGAGSPVLSRAGVGAGVSHRQHHDESVPASFLRLHPRPGSVQARAGSGEARQLRVGTCRQCAEEVSAVGMRERGSV